MRNLGKYIFVLMTVLLSSCGGQTTHSQEDGDTVPLKYASLLTIVRHDSYTVVTIRNPWKEGLTLHTYVLLPRGSEQPEGLPHGTLVRTPIERAAVFTTVHCSLLTTLGHGDDIVGVADLKYIKIPSIHEAVEAGRIADCGGGLNPVVEKIMDVKPDVILLSPFENSGGYGKLEDIDIPLVECAEYMENSPLARAEWMKFYGLLFGEEQQTDSLFTVVDSSYQALKKRAAEAGAGRSVLIDKMVGSVWYVPGGCSTIGRMVEDAGGRYPWAADEHSGSLSLPFETVLERAGDADVWMLRYSSDHEMDYRELLSGHRGYDHLKPFRKRRVYACNVEQSLFYEESPFRPDWLLSDFMQILHPGITNLPPLRYYKELKE
jgi:iron complex transport system substrate-binding protein